MEFTKTERLQEYFRIGRHVTIPKKKLWVYSELLQEDIFMDAEELYFRLYNKNQRVSLATIYGALKGLEILGLVKKRNPDNKISSFKIDVEKLVIS